MAIEKIKILGPFWSYQLNSTADLANLAQFWGKWAGLALLQNDPQDFDFSIAIGADYLSYVKSIATFAPTFYGYIIFVLVSVRQEHISFIRKHKLKSVQVIVRLHIFQMFSSLTKMLSFLHKK